MQIHPFASRTLINLIIVNKAFDLEFRSQDITHNTQLDMLIYNYSSILSKESRNKHFAAHYSSMLFEIENREPP